VKELENHLRIDGNRAFANENLGDEYAVLLDSPTRTSALVLRGLLRAEPKHPLASALARGLLGERQGGTWRSTQESAYALLALDAYRRAQEGLDADYQVKVAFGSQSLIDSALRGRSSHALTRSIPIAALQAAGARPLSFQKEGQGTLFYEARLRYAPRELPTQPLDRGFFVQKSMRRVTPETLAQALSSLPRGSSSSFQASDLVLTDLLVVTASPRDFVVIEDPLPAGFEAVDSNLANTARWLDIPESAHTEDDADDALAHQRAFLSSWFRSELRDDRALFFVDHMPAGMYRYRYLARATTTGKFVLPPTKAEQMYVPEVFGRTAAGRVDVR
jgi:uncharacterized protein YfaS (alpha-2-macroglobulin family)